MDTHCGVDDAKGYSEKVTTFAFIDNHYVDVVATFGFVLSAQQIAEVSRLADRGLMRGGHYDTWYEFRYAHQM